MTSICAAEGWFVEYEDQTVRRVAFFLKEPGSVHAYVIADKGYIAWASSCGKVIDIWHIHDER